MIELLFPALVAALILLVIHAYMGIHVIARGVIFVDLALAQMAALGFTVAALAGLAPDSIATYFVGLGATLAGAAILSATRVEHEFITQEALIGVIFVTASAATVLLASQAPRGAEHVQHLLTGTLLWVTWTEILRIGGAYLMIGAAHWALRRRFMTISLRPAEAREHGWRLGWWDFLFYALFGVMVTSSVAVAGVLVVFSFLVIPAAIAFLFTKDPRQLLPLAWLAGTLATVAGLLVSFHFDLPTGPVIVCTFTAALLLALGLRRVTREKKTIEP